MKKANRIISTVLVVLMLLTSAPLGGLVGLDLPDVFKTEASAAYENTYSNTGDQRADIIGVAKTQLGYTEGANNSTKYGTWYGLPNQPWCAMFISWCARQANIPTSVIPNISYVPYYDNSSVFQVKKGNYTPKPGDIFFTKSESHVGLVSSIDGSYFYSIEGNSNTNGSSDGVAVVSNRRLISNFYYAVPNYASFSHTRDTSYGTNFTAYPKRKIVASEIFYSDHTQYSSGAWIGTSDLCTIHEVYTDGCCKVSYPGSGGKTVTMYSRIELFNIPPKRKTIVRGWIGDSEGKTKDNWYLGDRIYLWAEIYDKNTGELYNTYSDDSYTLELYLYKPNGEIAYSTTRQNDDKTWISVSLTKSYYGTCKWKVVVKWSDGSVANTLEGYIVTKCNATFSVDKASLNLDLVNKKTDVVTYTLSGVWPENAKVEYIYDKSIISMSTEGSQRTITALKDGETDLTVNILYGSNKDILRSVKTHVKVSHTHNYTNNTTSSNLKTAAGCTSAAVYYKSCSICGARSTSTFTNGSALGHSYTSKTVSSTYLKSSATCTSAAVYYYKCARCSAKGTSTYTSGSSLGHSYSSSYTTDTAATCTSAGSKSRHCTRSGCTAKTDVTSIPATGHNYTSKSTTSTYLKTSATCTNAAVYYYKCANCTAKGTSTYTSGSALGHSYSSSYTTDTAATCTSAGSKSRHCTRSGCTAKTDVTVIPTTNHNFIGTKKEPTCTDNGFYSYTCISCKKIKIENIPPLGHAYSSDYIVDKPATCTSTGSKSRYCTRSGCTAKTDVTSIPATGHNYTSKSTTSTYLKTSATCTNAAVYYYKCANCTAKGTSTYTSGSALGHSYSSSYTTDTAATCTSAGSKSRHCTRSGCTAKTDVTSIPATSHSYTSKTTTSTYLKTAATCTNAAEYYYKCASCSAKGTSTYTSGSALGHSYSSSYTTDTEATCSTTGSKSRHCTRSGCTAKTDITTIPATGHVYDNGSDLICNVCGYNRSCSHCFGSWITMQEATCTNTGLKYRECSSCNSKEYETISVINHDLNTTITPATLTANGKTETKCSVCGNVSKTTTIYYPKTFTLSATKFTYTGKAIKPTVTVKDSNGKAIAASNYTVSYSSNINTGTGKVTIKFKGNYSGTKTVNFTITPKQVTGLKASTVKTDSIKLSWSKTGGAKYYKVERSTDGKKWTVLTTTGSTSYTASKLTAGAKYQFRVTALDSTKKIAGKSSTVLKTGTLTKAPTLTLKSTKAKTATASWKKVTGASKYVVYKSTDGKKWTKVTTTTKTSYNLTKLTGGKKIYVKVTALNAYSKASAYSSVKNVTVKK